MKLPKGWKIIEWFNYISIVDADYQTLARVPYSYVPTKMSKLIAQALKEAKKTAARK